MIPRVDEMTEPVVVGRYYLVPTVRYPYFGSIQDWPVIGPRHNDVEFFDFHWQHYHIDGRFLTARQRHFIGKRNLRNWLNVVSATPLAYCLPMQYSVMPHPAPVWKRRKCHFAALPYPFRHVSFVNELRHAYRGARLRGPCKVCPHRGAPLASLAPDADGLITCPAHGLRWKVDTGEAVP